jgi:hypothetical protein
VVSQKKWRKLSGTNRLPEVIQGVEFKDGIKQRSKRRLISPSPTFGHSSLRGRHRVPSPDEQHGFAGHLRGADMASQG